MCKKYTSIFWSSFSSSIRISVSGVSVDGTMDSKNKQEACTLEIYFKCSHPSSQFIPTIIRNVKKKYFPVAEILRIIKDILFSDNYIKIKE